MALELLISTYGYPALLVGTFLEGETILVLAGFLAHRGYFDLPLVVLIASLGTFAGDQFFFWLGRIKGTAYLKRKQSWQPRVEKVRARLEQHRIAVILGFRFLYGIRSVTPFVIGASDFAPARFVALNACGALLWAVTIGTGGYLLGHALEILLGDIKRYEFEILGVIAVIGLVIWGIYLRREQG